MKRRGRRREYILFIKNNFIGEGEDVKQHFNFIYNCIEGASYRTLTLCVFPSVVLLSAVKGSDLDHLWYSRDPRGAARSEVFHRVVSSANTSFIDFT